MKLKRIKLNKKGFSMVEAIAVTAIMAIIAVIIGSLLASSSNYYNKSKDEAAAKDISKVIEKVIWQEVVNASVIYLQNGTTETDLPASSFPITGLNASGETVVLYYLSMNNAPFKKSHYRTLTTYNGATFSYPQIKNTEDGASASFMPLVKELDASSNVVNSASFYSNYIVNVYYKAIKNGNGYWQSVMVFADVYKKGETDKDGNLKPLYVSSGRLIEPKQMLLKKADAVFSYSNLQSDLATKANGTYDTNYVNMLNKTVSGELYGNTQKFSYIHYNG